MPTWYIAKLSYGEVKPVEVERFTDQCVWVRIYNRKQATRQSKVSNYEVYAPTWEEAHQALLSRRDSELAIALSRLQVARDQFDAVKSMRNPDAAVAAA